MGSQRCLRISQILILNGPNFTKCGMCGMYGIPIMSLKVFAKPYVPILYNREQVCKCAKFWVENDTDSDFLSDEKPPACLPWKYFLQIYFGGNGKACSREGHVRSNRCIDISVPVPVTAQSKTSVCGRSLASTAGSNPARSMSVCLVTV